MIMIKNIASIINNDLANGPGIRTSVFFAGCDLHCEGCHNPSLWDFNMGKEVDPKIILNALQDRGIERGLSILGGEPLHWRNIQHVIKLVRYLTEEIPNLDIMIWTGKVLNQKTFCVIIELLKIKRLTIIDGPYVYGLPAKPWRGSSNQKIWRYENGSIIKED